MSGGSKPLDVGNGAACASFGVDGSWLSIGGLHSAHGFVELNGLPVFDEAWRGDPVATRRYRGWMTEDRFAFLRLELPGRPSPAAPNPLRPRWLLSSPTLIGEVEAWADERGCVQRHRLSIPPGTDGPTDLTLRFHGRLDRPALAEITEVNPPASTRARTQLAANGDELRVVATALPASVLLTVRCDPPVPLNWRLTDDGAELAMVWPNASQLTVEVVGQLDGAPTPAGLPSATLDAPIVIDPRALFVPDELRANLEGIIARALAYVRGCTALSLTAGERAILTDHRVLPLSWTRDAYYQALLLLSTGLEADTALVESHLRWLWLRNERPDGRWLRSHHANGKRKDLTFQIDQQLYPLLELADWWRATGSLPPAIDWTPLVDVAWDAALRAVDPSTGLVATAETAGDDPVTRPFVLASQIVFWYTATRLVELVEAGMLRLDADTLAALADRSRRAVAAYLADSGGWAYATDARGQRQRYHDANDLPTALAPLWGYCSSDDPAWQITMRDGLSPSNAGYFAGPYGGLGSLHTEGAWPLGDVQAWIFASLAKRTEDAESAVTRLCGIALDDGMLPEAYDPETGLVSARHWFAWPGAILGALLLLDGRRLLRHRLHVGG